MDYSTPTRPSSASRFPELRSAASCRGFVVHQDQVLVFESRLEHFVIYMLAAMPDVVCIEDQPSPVTYVDSQGKVRRHTVDFRVTLRDGRRLVILVKTASKAAKAWAVARALADQLPPGFADEIHVVTEADFSRIDRYNAQLMFESARFPIEAHDAEIDRITARTRGALKISDLVEVSGLGGAAFKAIVRLIAVGTLRQATPGKRIGYDTYVVRRTSATH